MPLSDSFYVREKNIRSPPFDVVRIVLVIFIRMNFYYLLIKHEKGEFLG